LYVQPRGGQTHDAHRVGALPQGRGIQALTGRHIVFMQESLVANQLESSNLRKPYRQLSNYHEPSSIYSLVASTSPRTLFLLPSHLHAHYHFFAFYMMSEEPSPILGKLGCGSFEDGRHGNQHGFPRAAYKAAVPP